MANILTPDLRSVGGFTARDKQHEISALATPENIRRLNRTLSKHFEEHGPFFLQTSTSMQYISHIEGAPTPYQQYQKDVELTLGPGFDPKGRGNNCAMKRTCYMQPEFVNYAHLEDPQAVLDKLFQDSSRKLAHDVINGEYSYCHSLVSAEARAVNEVSVMPPREIILSPHAKASDLIHEGFMKTKKMHGYAVAKY